MAWIDHDGDLPVLPGTLIRLQVEHLPGDRDPKPVWLWSSRTGAAPDDVDRLWQALRLARHLTDDLRRPWEPPARQGRLTPARVRRGFRNLHPKTTHPAGAPKPSAPGPGRPRGSKKRQAKAPKEHFAGLEKIDPTRRTDPDRRRVRITGGVRELSARYLVGCDGAGSTVCGLAGFDFAGTDATVTGRMAVVDMVDQEKLRPGFHYTPHGVYVHGLGVSRMSTVESTARRGRPSRSCRTASGG